MLLTPMQSISFKAVHLAKHQLPNLSIWPSNSTLSSWEQPEKASSPIASTPSGTKSDVSPVQPQQEHDPISFTYSGIWR
mgnify:CR=1 FL=1